ncbi:MAG TPA: hypothetical protein PKY96_08110 [Flavobacteriales bacterium]|nr:hypothetical protein [Flavobacteriales bacterium]
MLRSIALSALLALVSPAFAQFGAAPMRTILKKGDFSALKDESNVLLTYSYDKMIVGKFTEEDYVSKKRKEHNDKESGKGDRWAEKWVAARADVYEPKFEELLNERFAKGKAALKAGKDFSDAKYMLKVHTTDTEPGYNVGISRMPGYITATITLHETASPDVVLAEVEIQRAPAQDAMGFDFDASGRIGEGYAKMGKELGAWLTKSDWGRKR